MPLLLVVDDQAINIQTIFQIFEDEYDVAMATSGVEALEFCQKRVPDLILLDVLMPGMDGYEVCRRLKSNAHTRDVPVIFVTVQSDPTDEAEGLENGAVDYITKPIVDTVVKARVRTHLALRQTVRELARSQEELFHAEKLVALGNLVAGVAHELNTPLGNALMTASTLNDANRILKASLEQGNLKRTAFDEYVRGTGEGLALILRSLGRATNLIETFKQVAIEDTGETRHKFMLDELVTDIVGAMALSLEPAQVRCETSVDGGIELDSFPSALGKVLMSLIQNAQVHGYANQPGVIHISGARTNGQSVSIRLEDHGRGIEPENLSRIFDPFFSTQFGQGASGLGLSITRNLVTLVLGGRIDVESKLGEGTRFSLTLPLVAPDVKPAEAPATN